MTKPPSGIRVTDAAARGMARDLISAARFGALAVLSPETGRPVVSRVAIATTPQGALLTLVSDLSGHTAALRHDPRCSVLVGEPAGRGDPLTHPRLTLEADACFIRKGDAGYQALRDHYLKHRPKAGLYIEFMDFSFVRFDVTRAHLNGGFGKAFVLSPDDLMQD
jgi:putative heme iron utilization protein